MSQIIDSIFLLGREDAKQLAALEAMCFPTSWSSEHYARKLGSRISITLDSTGDELLASLPVLGIENMQGQLVAYLVLGVAVAVSEVEIYNIAVHEGYRRQGLARRLIMEAQRLARKVKIDIFFLEVRKDNAAAISLYQELGFNISGERKKYYSDGEDALLMDCALEPSELALHENTFDRYQRRE